MNKPVDRDSGVLPEETFLTGSSETAALIRARDWSDTPLGPIESWPQSLRTTVGLCLASNFPINIIWGPDNVQIYNDGYRIICGDKHPASLGMDFTECWASAWPEIGLPFEQARAGKTSFLENQRITLFRNGYLEETFFTFSFSPIRDESGNIGGLFHPVTETTATMLSERRTRVLRDLTSQLGTAASRAELYRLLMQTLAGFDLDLPFVLLYEREGDGGYRLAGTAGVAGGTAISPEMLAPQDTAAWPMPALMTADAALRVDGLRARIGSNACGPYEEPPETAFALPIVQPGSAAPSLLLMAGASARLPVDDAYTGFYDLLRGALGAALARVDAAEAERKRAEMLAAIDHAKTVFFSNVSHEFRTPLTLMLAPLEEALEAADLAPPQRAQLDIAHRNAQRLLRLVNSLLDFSRIEAGRINAHFAAADLASLTVELASNFRSACERAGLAFTVDCPALPGEVFADTAMWEKIVLNLLSNAFKFTLAGGITVTLREAGGMAELRVADTGVGIPPGDLERVFERFHRIEGQAGRSVEGSGIGLSLVRELVQLHGGTIAAASEPGRGTTFTVRLPFGAAHLPAQQAAAPSGLRSAAQAHVDEALGWLPDEAQPQAPAQPQNPVRRGRVVLADDNADMRAYIRRILEEGGYEVEALGNGRQALEAVRAAAAGVLPDLVLSDVMMPELDGFALLAALRADPATRNVVVMLLSARAGEEARLEGLGAGADDYLVKPFGARELRARVDGAVNLGRQRHEAALRELVRSQAHAAALFEQTRVGMAEATLDGILVNVNRRYCDMIGLPRERIIGQRVDAFLHPDDAPDNRALFDALVRRGTPYEIENRFLRADGQPLWVGKTVTLVHSAPGDPPTVLAVYMDVSERKEAEAALHETARRKDDFLAMLAHELRNPLAPIRTAAEMMGLATLDATRIRRTSEIIGRQVRHMTELIDDLLDVSRVTRGLVEIDKTPQDLPTIVANAVEQVSPLLASQRQEFVMNIDPAGGRVLGDEKRLVQILTNLLNNAAKYTPPGGTIRLRTEVESDCVHVIVQDTGIGIAPELRSHIFDLFAQAERTPDRSQGGLGLGLALVRSLVELHGGRVACHSGGMGKGSTFVFQLPRIADEEAAPAAASVAAAVQASAGQRDILVVDDNADAGYMLKILLEQRGHRVRVEHDAYDALDSIARQAPDIALIDIGLPGMDGNALARRLRSLPGGAALTLVAVTGYGQELDRQRTLEAGFDRHLVKPVDTADLAAVLDIVRPANNG
ncbi:ATP-binding protein [Massilia sp. LXY-6]|uniref:ATP-binding protein n=1 Tax=Massilia sp. LXY-6 TaxID=3379823 RepID=UPI003EDF4FC6